VVLTTIDSNLDNSNYPYYKRSTLILCKVKEVNLPYHFGVHTFADANSILGSTLLTPGQIPEHSM
jgi:hypothetical protein